MLPCANAHPSLVCLFANFRKYMQLFAFNFQAKLSCLLPQTIYGRNISTRLVLSHSSTPPAVVSHVHSASGGSRTQ